MRNCHVCHALPALAIVNLPDDPPSVINILAVDNELTWRMSYDVVEVTHRLVFPHKAAAISTRIA